MTIDELQKLKDDVYDDYRELLDTTYTYDEGIATRTKVMNLIDAEIKRQSGCAYCQNPNIDWLSGEIIIPDTDGTVLEKLRFKLCTMCGKRLEDET